MFTVALYELIPPLEPLLHKRGAEYMQVVGIKHVDYFSQKKNAQVSGVEVHYSYEDEKIEGVGVGSVYMSENLISKSGGYVPEIGDEIEIYYNQFKSPACIVKVEG